MTYNLSRVLSQDYPVMPGTREQEVMVQMLRPALQSPSEQSRLGYLPTAELNRHCDAMCQFGVDRDVRVKIAKQQRLQR